MAERGIIVDHSTLHRWVIRLVQLLDKTFRRHKRTVGRRWRMDETYIKIKGQWKYLYRAVDTAGQTIDFLLTVSGMPQQPCVSFARPSDTTMSLKWWPLIKAAPTRRRWSHLMPVNLMKKLSPSGKANI